MRLLTVSCGLALLWACSDETDSGVRLAVPLVTAQASQVLDDCPAGGVVLDWGVDDNGNGELEPSEVARTYAVCNGEDGQGAPADDVARWNEAYAWGDHAAAAYVAVETDPAFSASSVSKTTLADIARWDAAHGWGDHGAAGYLASEVDPAYQSSAAATIGQGDVDRWNAVAGWGDHRTAGYISVETDPAFAQSAVAQVSSVQVSRWNAAFEWGDHASEDYLTTESDPLVRAFAKTALPNCGPNDVLSGNAGQLECRTLTAGAPAPSLASVLQTDNDAGGRTITNVLAPVASSDVATKGYVDAAMAGGDLSYGWCCSQASDDCSSAFPGWTCVDASQGMIALPRGEGATLTFQGGNVFLSALDRAEGQLLGCSGVAKFCYSTFQHFYIRCMPSGAPPTPVLPGFSCQQVDPVSTIGVFPPGETAYVLAPGWANNRFLIYYYQEVFRRNQTFCDAASVPDQYVCWR